MWLKAEIKGKKERISRDGVPLNVAAVIISGLEADFPKEQRNCASRCGTRWEPKAKPLRCQRRPVTIAGRFSSASFSPSSERAVQTNPVRLNHLVRLNQICHRSRAEPARSESSRFEEGLQKPEFSNPAPFPTLEQVAQPALSCHPQQSHPSCGAFCEEEMVLAQRCLDQRDVWASCRCHPGLPAGPAKGTVGQEKATSQGTGTVRNKTAATVT
ncbi:uncharacterized protein [Numenius arquata]|uniref:uncharacterized protein n=1 Tax=Numenius arquata TaxID=31919 RepID=UPI003D30A3B9